MKNKILFPASVLAGFVLLIVACQVEEVNDSTPQLVSQPYVVEQYVEDLYAYGLGNVNIQNDVPDVVAIAVDSVFGFEGGYGGKTGADTVQIKKSDILGGWPTITDLGSYGITFEKFNKGNYRVLLSTTVVVVTNNNPGPTDLSGTYLRAATGFLQDFKKAADGVFVLTNPGGASSIPSKPYLLFNYKNSSGGDSLSFANQGDVCGSGGIQLVSASAPTGLTSSTYSQAYPPEITSTSPLTLAWRIYEFPSTSASATQRDPACAWGTAVRTWVKQ